MNKESQKLNLDTEFKLRPVLTICFLSINNTHYVSAPFYYNMTN